MKKRLLIALVVVLALAAGASVVSAGGPWYVATTGNDANDCLSWATACATIQATIGKASPGDTIYVGMGTYFGATVTKAVDIRGQDATINDGPNSHSFLRAGFLFPGGGAGSGATISGFIFQGTPQSTYTDDGNLDFPIFSRGANDVTVKDNLFNESLQAITNWHGTGWHIYRNTIDGLWTLCGGGIGIFIGSFDGTPANDNVVGFNSISAVGVDPGCAPYSTPGIGLMSDNRYGRTGGPVQDNKVLHNHVSVTGQYDSTDTGAGIELTDLVLMGGGSATVTDNKVAQNEPSESTIPLALNPSGLADYNVIHNNPGPGVGHGPPPASIY